MSATVLHVLPQDMERGAQRYARELVDALDRPSQRHVVVTLFESSATVLKPDATLSLRASFARRLGYDPRVVPRLRRAVAAIAPTCVVAHGSEPLKYLVAARAEPIVYYKIGVTHLSGGAHLRRAMHRRLLATPVRVVGVSTACTDEAVSQFSVPVSKTLVIPNGRKPEPYLTAERTPTQGRVNLVFVAHLTTSKRPEVFLDIVEALRRRGADIHATVVGGGPLLSKIERRSRSLGVHVTGPVSGVAEILARSHIFVFTSLPEGEGMPGVLIEAGLSSLPTVTTDVPGARDVINHGETGWIVPPETPMDAVPHLMTLIDNPTARQAMGAAARQRCMANFTLGASAAKWSRFLDSLGPSGADPGVAH